MDFLFLFCFLIFSLILGVALVRSLNLKAFRKPSFTIVGTIVHHGVGKGKGEKEKESARLFSGQLRCLCVCVCVCVEREKR